MQGNELTDELSLKHFGARCQYFRKKIGYSSADTFAFEKGFERAYWGRVERGEKNVHYLTFLRICRALDVTPVEFFSKGFE